MVITTPSMFDDEFFGMALVITTLDLSILKHKYPSRLFI
jgi:hypothetical protein